MSSPSPGAPKSSTVHDPKVFEYHNPAGVGCAQGSKQEHLLHSCSKATITCWAMGTSQYMHSVPAVREIVNLLLCGNLGKFGAALLQCETLLQPSRHRQRCAYFALPGVHGR
ncbi:hypothetical protein [Vreelandella nanhaiensis]|uniref:Uncharacterized protein n=1 Tax=Vreelandella nanhaiensis TaxID=1258546 RepID=A0A433KP86_9GAMM|nr:hypothetical protein [Halomonas nanhaiensis]RUR31367.1 hypothetical protein ELY38_11990 [Halomonas nanhaiensis]